MGRRNFEFRLQVHEAFTKTEKAVPKAHSSIHITLKTQFFYNFMNA